MKIENSVARMQGFKGSFEPLVLSCKILWVEPESFLLQMISTRASIIA
jgi:hypothetical protein